MNLLRLFWPLVLLRFVLKGVIAHGRRVCSSLRAKSSPALSGRGMFVHFRTAAFGADHSHAGAIKRERWFAGAAELRACERECSL